jgi:hypothetical protein
MPAVRSSSRRAVPAPPPSTSTVRVTIELPAAVVAMVTREPG